MMTLAAVVRGASFAGGQLLRAASEVVPARPAAKPLHPSGTVLRGTLVRQGSGLRTGAAWLDDGGEDTVLVRASRAVGLPPAIPDIFGLALRTPTGDGRYGDLLLATTGLGRLTRFTLTPAWTPYSRPMTTLLPCRTPIGPVLVSAVVRDEVRVTLAWAARLGDWHRFADLVLERDPVEGPDALVSFDPVENGLPGLETYDWVRRLREPAYATARRSRRGFGGPRRGCGASGRRVGSR